MMRLWLLAFLIGISSGLKYIEERDVMTSSGKVFTCFYTIQYNAKGVVSTKKSSVSCTPNEKGGSAMPVFDLPGVGPTSIKHNVQKGKDSVQDYSPYSAPINNQAMPLNCSCSLKLSTGMMAKPNGSNALGKPDEKPEIKQIIEKMCSEKKPEMLKELFEKIGLTKEKVIEMMKSPGGKEKLIQHIMMELGISDADKQEMLQNLSQMGQPGGMGGMGAMGRGIGGKPGGGKPGGMGGHGHGGMGGGMGGHGHGGMGGGMGGHGQGGMGGGMGGHGHGGMGGGMGGHGQGGMGGGMEVPSCVKKMMMMICSVKKPPKPQCMPLTTCKVKEHAMQMFGDMMEMKETGEASMNVNCECLPMKKGK